MTTLKVLLLCVAILLLAATPAFCVKDLFKMFKSKPKPKPMASVAPIVALASADDMPKISSQFVILSGKTESSSILVADKKVFQLEASATTTTTTKTKPKKSIFSKFTKSKKPTAPTKVEHIVNYSLQPASAAAAASLPCSKQLKWVSAELSECWELHPNFVIGYSAKEMTVYWETLYSNQMTVSFKKELEKLEAQRENVIHVLVSGDSTHLDIFTVTFVVVQHPKVAPRVISFLLSRRADGYILREATQDLVILQKEKELIGKYGAPERTVRCMLIYESSLKNKERGFVVRLSIVDLQDTEFIPPRFAIFEEFKYWQGSPSFDILIDNKDVDDPFIQFFYYDGYSRLRELRLSQTDGSALSYPLDKIPGVHGLRKVKHWVWRHTPAQGQQTVTHAFLTGDNDLYLIPQNMLNDNEKPSRYSAFTLVEGSWQPQGL